MGLVATASPYSRGTCETQNNTISWRLKVWICLQAVLSAVRLYVSYAMLAYLPLGDAVTIMFVEPLFTLVFSFLFLRLSASLWRILLCFGLLLGMVFTVQPPFVFGKLKVKN
jgi:drug/metabolite transporter (DMT)-like permease